MCQTIFKNVYIYIFNVFCRWLFYKWTKSRDEKVKNAPTSMMDKVALLGLKDAQNESPIKCPIGIRSTRLSFL